MEAYFITFCTKNREEHFGKIKNGIMGLNQLGSEAALMWQKIPKALPDVKIGKWVIMPNHIHGVIFMKNISGLQKIITSFKNSLKEYADREKIGLGWESDYYSRLISNKYESDAVDLYIGNNTKYWEKDPNNIINFLSNDFYA